MYKKNSTKVPQMGSFVIILLKIMTDIILIIYIITP